MGVDESDAESMLKRANAWLPQRLNRWAQIRARGRTLYIWGDGVLRWGGSMFCFSIGVYHYRQFGTIFSAEGCLWFRLLTAALVWTYVGYLYGRASWHQNECEYLTQKGPMTTSVEM